MAAKKKIKKKAKKKTAKKKAKKKTAKKKSKKKIGYKPHPGPKPAPGLISRRSGWATGSKQLLFERDKMNIEETGKNTGD